MKRLLITPDEPRALFVFAHGAGAGMHHPFMEAISELLCNQGIATFRYEFTFMSEGRKRPDSGRVLEERIREAVGKAGDECPGLPLIAGGKSMGGRLTSLAAAASPLPGVCGLVFLGYPFHTPGKAEATGTSRVSHLGLVDLPVLFVQGTRDRLAEMDLVKKVCRAHDERATLHVVDDGDHSFKVLKRTGRNQTEVYAEIANTISTWTDSFL